MGGAGASFSKYPMGGTIPKGGFDTLCDTLTLKCHRAFLRSAALLRFGGPAAAAAPKCPPLGLLFLLGIRVAKGEGRQGLPRRIDEPAHHNHLSFTVPAGA